MERGAFMINQKPQILILCGDGVNCENETARAFIEAGASTKIIHVNDMVKTPALLEDFDAMAIPGGFSFGDELGSGRLLALKLKLGLTNALDKFIADKKPIIGICNGFQVLVKMGLLPFKKDVRQVTLTNNDSGEFINKWAELEVPANTRCQWLTSLRGKTFSLPIRHGEGRIVISNEKENLALMNEHGLVALRYKNNENGSVDQIAGLCDEEGLIFGLMPHPEANIFKMTNPSEKVENVMENDFGFMVFKNIVEHINNKNL
jgi:phosphoribosylformylglycinamidine synthase